MKLRGSMALRFSTWKVQEHARSNRVESNERWKNAVDCDRRHRSFGFGRSRLFYILSIFASIAAFPAGYRHAISANHVRGAADVFRSRPGGSIADGNGAAAGRNSHLDAGSVCGFHNSRVNQRSNSGRIRRSKCCIDRSQNMELPLLCRPRRHVFGSV